MHQLDMVKVSYRLWLAGYIQGWEAIPILDEDQGSGGVMIG